MWPVICGHAEHIPIHLSLAIYELANRPQDVSQDAHKSTMLPPPPRSYRISSTAFTLSQFHFYTSGLLFTQSTLCESLTATCETCREPARTMGDRGVSRLVSVLLSSASLSLSLPLSFTKQICRFIPLCSLQGGRQRPSDKSQSGLVSALSAVIDLEKGQNATMSTALLPVQKTCDELSSVLWVLRVCTQHYTVCLRA